MTKEDLFEILQVVRKQEEFITKAGAIGIDMIDSDVFNGIHILIKVIFREAFGDKWKEPYDWFDWYCFELPMLRVHHKDDDDVFARNADGSPIPFETDDDLWEFINDNYIEEKLE